MTERCRLKSRAIALSSKLRFDERAMDGIYEPELIQKGQTRINGMDDKIIHCPLGVAWWCRKL